LEIKTRDLGKGRKMKLLENVLYNRGKIMGKIMGLGFEGL